MLKLNVDLVGSDHKDSARTAALSMSTRKPAATRSTPTIPFFSGPLHRWAGKVQSGATTRRGYKGEEHRAVVTDRSAVAIPRAGVIAGRLQDKTDRR
jgi:hypothetical protein